MQDNDKFKSKVETKLRLSSRFFANKSELKLIAFDFVENHSLS